MCVQRVEGGVEQTVLVQAVLWKCIAWVVDKEVNGEGELTVDKSIVWYLSWDGVRGWMDDGR